MPAIINTFLEHDYESLALPIYDSIHAIVFQAIVPVSVLVINVVVAVQVRRAASNASANLGVQHAAHHQSTSGSNSAVPTVMLIVTSLVYVLLLGTYSTITVLFSVSRMKMVDYENVTLIKIHFLVSALTLFVFVYNFYVYLITGKQFRSDLRKLLCSCLSSSVAADGAEVARRGR